jgi:DNA polymerase
MTSARMTMSDSGQPSDHAAMASKPAPFDASPFLPKRRSLAALRRAGAGCRGCDLWQPATQTVFGEGSDDASVMLVGETPGDREDLAGRPFVGPAGRELDKALDAVGLDRGSIYVTNAVKHFKFRARGKRRIHQRPNVAEITACRPWLEAELEVIRPDALIVLGAVAARALLGTKFRLLEQRGRLIESELAPVVLATIHPAAILRAGDARQAEREAFTEDLRTAARAIAALNKAA